MPRRLYRAAGHLFAAMSGAHEFDGKGFGFGFGFGRGF